ncbi:hypothetical protein BX666DRAFT_1875693 [Dichotomocladium elegans]|nr:hypothetical protein BX666DRAFT_1875693 [Dichotomocladium elegans]
MSYRPSPFPRRSVSSVGPFTVKRKQKSKELVDFILEGKSVAELDARIRQLEESLKKAVYEQQKWRHQCRLMETEREKFEQSVQMHYEKDKELLEIEIKTLKEAHLSKVQDLLNTIGRLQKTIDALREQLGKHDIVEEPCSRSDEASTEAILSRLDDTEEAEFIKHLSHLMT